MAGQNPPKPPVQFLGRGSSARSRLKSLYMAMPFKQQIFTMLRSVWAPSPNIYRYLYFRGKFKVWVGERHFLVNHYGFDIETSIFWQGLTGGWEKISLTAWLDLCKRAKVIFDVGANTGIYSLAAKAVNPAAQVFSFEPVRRVFEKLAANNQINQYDIHCEQVAVSNRDGEGVIYDLPTEHIYCVTLNKNLHNSDVPAYPVAVTTRRLSTFIEETGLPKVDLIKIDVESHEPEVLEGMGKYLDLMKPTILMEVWNDEVGNRAEAILAQHDYLFFSTEETEPFKPATHIRNPNPAKGYLNHLICSRQTADILNLLQRPEGN